MFRAISVNVIALRSTCNWINIFGNLETTFQASIRFEGHIPSLSLQPEISTSTSVLSFSSD